MEIRHFSDSWLLPLHKAFISAFSENEVPFNPSRKHFEKRILYKLNISRQLSAIAIENNEILGFTLHTHNYYGGESTIYNGGMGIVPQERRNSIGLQLFEFCYPRFKETNAKRVILEVITTNKPALSFYEKMGFTFTQTFKCYKNSSPNFSSYNKDVAVHEVDDWNPRRYRHMKSFEPSFIDSDEQIPYNIRNEIILEAKDDDQRVGFIILQPETGRISQFAIDVEARGKGIGKRLLRESLRFCKRNELTILNIPESERETNEGLIAMGFKNQVDQYEMQLAL